jgi:hypothetical protein
MKITINTIHTFLNTTMAWLRNGGELVPVKEAIQRSKICVECPYNNGRMRGRCPGCFARKAIWFIYGHLGNRVDGKPGRNPEKIPVSENPHNEELTYCGKCGCDLKLKVFIPTEVIDTTGVDYPVWCWQKEGYEKHTPPGRDADVSGPPRA